MDEDKLREFKEGLEAAKKRIEELEEENFYIRESILLKKIAVPEKLMEDKNFEDLCTLPTYEELYDKMAGIRTYVANKLNKANECIVDCLTQLECGGKSTAALKLAKCLTIQECLDNILVQIDRATDDDKLCKEDETARRNV